MRADNEALRAELGLPVAEIPETAIPDIDVAPPVKPVISPPESPDPNIPETDTVLPVPNVSPPGLTRDEAIDNLPATEMMVQHEDDYLIRIDPQAVQTNYILSQRGTDREFLRGTDKDDVFVDGQLEPLDFHTDLIDWDTALEFPELPNGSRINGLDGYDSVHLEVKEDTDQWVHLRNIEYLRVDFGPKSGGESFSSAWGDLPPEAYVYIDNEFRTAAVYDDGFNLVAT